MTIVGALAEVLGRFLAPILVPLIKQALAEFFSDSVEIAKPNQELQREAENVFGGLRVDDGCLRWRMRNQGDSSPAGDGFDSAISG